ncbi:hypothetical protein AAK938_09115 [Aerococcaceae bacterium 50-4]
MQVTNKTIYSYAVWIMGLRMLHSEPILLILLGHGLILFAFVNLCHLAYQEQSLIHLLMDLILMVIASFVLLMIPENIGIFKGIIGVIIFLIAVLIKDQVYKRNI